jgi:hypothetical protein
MVSTAFAAALKSRQIYYGWVVVAVTFLTMLVTAAAMGAPGRDDRPAAARIRLGQRADF